MPHLPRIIRKTSGKETTEKFKITLGGFHPPPLKYQMFGECWPLFQRCGFEMAGQIDIYVPVYTIDLRPLSRLPDGSLIKEHLIFLENPYQSAADEYDLRFCSAPPPPKPR